MPKDSVSFQLTTGDPMLSLHLLLSAVALGDDKKLKRGHLSSFKQKFGCVDLVNAQCASYSLAS